MAGHTNIAFRTLIRELGQCGLVCSELISSQALKHNPNSRRTRELMDWSPREKPFAVQLFGSVPEDMARAARLVVAYGAPIVDINMGCWVPKVAKKGCGAALLADLPRAREVVQAVCEAVEVPVTAKIRIGFKRDRPTAVPFALSALEAGVSMLTVHGRYAEDGFGGRSDHLQTARVVEAVEGRIPIIYNGDVEDLQSAKRALAETRADGLMIGRAALREPWLFQVLAATLTEQPKSPPAGASKTPLDIALRHYQLAREFIRKPEAILVRALRGQLLPYRLGAASDHRTSERNELETELRSRLVGCQSFSDLDRFFFLCSRSHARGW